MVIVSKLTKTTKTPKGAETESKAIQKKMLQSASKREMVPSTFSVYAERRGLSAMCLRVIT